MSLVKAGDRIAVHYRAYGPGQALLCASESGSPLVMTAGGDDVLRGLSLAVIGMQVGEQKTLRLAPADAYGEAPAALERTIHKSRLPRELVVGDVVRLSVAGMSALLWILEALDGELWRVSTSHPLAGQVIDLQVQLLALDS